MKLNQDNLVALWKINLDVMVKRSPKWILRSFTIPFLLSIILLLIKQIPILTIAIVLGCFFILVFGMFLKVRSIKNHRFREPYSYNKSVLLYQTYEFIFLATFAIVSWGVGDDMLFRSDSMDSQTIEILRIYLLLILFMLLVFMFIIFPTLSIQKIRRLSKPHEFSKTHIRTIAVLYSLPSMIAFLAIMLTRTGDEIQNLFVGGVICIMVAYFLFVIAANILFEALVLFINTWPTIKRNGTSFTVIYDPPNRN